MVRLIQGVVLGVLLATFLRKTCRIYMGEYFYDRFLEENKDSLVEIMSARLTQAIGSKVDIEMRVRGDWCGSKSKSS